MGGPIETPRQITVAALVGQGELRAAGFIVTLYGDVVEPRGGLLWMGTLVEVCGLVGISETRVRTAVSRLVAAGRLEGMRAGRLSYYRLTEAARREFAEAAALVFDPPPRPARWLIAESASGPGFAALGGGLAIGPDSGRPPDGALVFAATLRQGRAALHRFAEERWGLAGQAAAYAGFLARFAPLAAALPADEEASFIARTLLVHAFRAVVLGDPRLPAEALPADWPEDRARQLFARLYRRLSPASDSFVSRAFASLDGPLPAATDATRRRLQALAGPVTT